MLIDHDMDLVLTNSSHVYVLSSERILPAGTPAQIRADHRVAETYLGAAHAMPPEPLTPEVASRG